MQTRFPSSAGEVRHGPLSVPGNRTLDRQNSNVLPSICCTLGVYQCCATTAVLRLYQPLLMFSSETRSLLPHEMRVKIRCYLLQVLRDSPQRGCQTAKVLPARWTSASSSRNVAMMRGGLSLPCSEKRTKGSIYLRGMDTFGYRGVPKGIHPGEFRRVPSSLRHCTTRYSSTRQGCLRDFWTRLGRPGDGVTV